MRPGHPIPPCSVHHNGKPRMATFYLLPARASLDRSLSELLGRFLPGLPVPASAWDRVIEYLSAATDWPADVFLIPRDDLPDDEAPADALRTGFGAETGDRVVEVGPARCERAWVLGSAGVSEPAAAR